MLPVVLSLLLITAVALAVVGVVAVPARRAGREVLTHRGASTLDSLRERVTPRAAVDDTAPAAPAPALRTDEPARLSA